MRTHVWFFLTGFEVVMIKYSSLIYQFSSGNITKYVNRKQRRLPVEHLNPVSISNIKAKSAVKLVWSEGSLLSCDWLAWQEEVRRVKTIGYRYTIHLIWIYTTTCLQKNKVLSGLTCRQLERVFKYRCSLWQWFILVCALVQVIVSCQVSWLQTLGQWSFSGRTSQTHLRVNKYSGTALYDVTAGWNSDWTVNWMFSDWSSGCSVPSKSDCLQFHRAHSDWMSVFTCTE